MSDTTTLRTRSPSREAYVAQYHHNERQAAIRCALDLMAQFDQVTFAPNPGGGYVVSAVHPFELSEQPVPA